MNNLAAGYYAAGKLDLALPLCEETLNLTKAKHGPDHPDTLTSMNNLAGAYLASKEPTKAAPLFEEYLGVKRKQLGKSDPRFASLLANVALDLFKYQQYSSAEPMLRECLEIRTKTQPDVWSTFNTKSMLGGALLGQKKYQEAEPLLKEGYEGMKTREKSIPAASKVYLTEAVARLVQFYDATGNKTEADRYRKELAARKAAEKSPEK